MIDVNIFFINLQHKIFSRSIEIFSSSHEIFPPQVDTLHIRHAGVDEYFEFDQLENSRITINLKEETDIVEGRLHYAAEQKWSPWGSSDSPVSKIFSVNFLTQNNF